MKKLLFLLFIGFSLMPILVAARSGCPTEGLVPCGTPGCPCQFCDFFVMFDRIIDFLLFIIVPSLAALMIAIGGFMYIFAHVAPAEAISGGSKGGPQMLSQAKKLFTSVAFGLLIIYGAWLIVNTFFMMIGVQSWTGLEGGWWQINCN